MKTPRIANATTPAGRLLLLLGTPLAWVTGAVLWTTAPAMAQNAGLHTEGSHIQISLVTFGPGRVYWERFGHNAIWVRDTVAGIDSLYDYGRFSFQQPGFLWKFVRGRMEYWMGSAPALPLIRAYVNAGRAVWVQDLAISPEKRVELRDFLLWNDRPENKFYRYHYFYDNCSTRVRDALDMAVNGQLRAQLDTVPVDQTYRSQAARMTADNLLLYTGLMIGLALPTDRPLNAWDDAFIPMELREHIRLATVDTPNGPTPLVVAEHTVSEGNVPPVPERPPHYTLLFLAVGTIIAAGLVAVGFRESKRQTSHKLFTVYAVVWSFLVGISGCILAFLWIFTDHNTSYWNENLFFFTPLALPIALALPLALRRVSGMVKLTVLLAAAVAGSSLLGFVVQLLPGFDQVNGQVIALTLPTNVALLITVFMVLGHPARHQPVGSVSTA